MIPVSWIHTHVASAPCGFSSIDMHTQYILEDIGMFGTVFEINKKNVCENFDFYTLTEEGFNVVRACREPANIQHISCYNLDFFCSIMPQVSIVDSLPLQISNFSAITPPEGFSATNPEICKCCLRRVPENKLMRHFGQRKACKLAYGTFYDNNALKRNRQKQARYDQANREKKRLKQAAYYENNKGKVKQMMAKYYKNNKDKVRKSQAKYYENNKEKLKQKQAKYDENNKENAKRRYHEKRVKKKEKERREKYNYKINEHTLCKIEFEMRKRSNNLKNKEAAEHYLKGAIQMLNEYGDIIPEFTDVKNLIEETYNKIEKEIDLIALKPAIRWCSAEKTIEANRKLFDDVNVFCQWHVVNIQIDNMKDIKSISEKLDHYYSRTGTPVLHSRYMCDATGYQGGTTFWKCAQCRSHFNPKTSTIRTINKDYIINLSLIHI